MAVTSFEDLKKVSTAETQLPPFADGTPFVAILRKVSIINMAIDGRVPNPLMKTVLKVLGTDSSENTESLEAIEKNATNDLSSNEESAKQSLEFLLTVVKNSLVSPTYEEIEKSGVKLSDEQLFAIFSYALGGMEILSKFC